MIAKAFRWTACVNVAGLLYISLDDGEAHVLRLNWGEWNHHLVPSPDGERLAFGANFFYDKATHG